MAGDYRLHPTEAASWRVWAESLRLPRKCWESLRSLQAKTASDTIGTLADERQELFPRFFAVAEAAQHGRRDRRRMLLLHAPHHHAQVASLNDHTDALRLDGVLNCFRDLRGQPLLHLQPAGKHFHQTWQLAQPDNLAIGNV